MTGSGSSGALPRAHVDKNSTAYRVRRMIRKFGPFTLIVMLLFGIKYFLISILVNLHYVKSNMQEQCDPHVCLLPALVHRCGAPLWCTLYPATLCLHHYMPTCRNQHEG